MPEGKGSGVHASPGFIHRSPGCIESMAHAWHTGESHSPESNRRPAGYESAAPLGSTGVLLGVVLATIVLTEFVTNNAAAALVFPIAMRAAADAGVAGRPFAIAVAASADRRQLLLPDKSNCR